MLDRLYACRPAQALSDAKRKMCANAAARSAWLGATVTRYAWFVERYGTRCWEVDAMSPVALRERLEVHVRSYLDMDAWDHAVEVERAETESMQSFLSTWNSSISGQTSKYSLRVGG